jgi:ATP-binding cassette, subfamily B, bacterial
VFHLQQITPAPLKTLANNLTHARRAAGSYTCSMTTPDPQQKRPNASAQSLSGLMPFLFPYRARIGLAILFLLLAAATTLAFPQALRLLIDDGLARPDREAMATALPGHFAQLFGVAVALAVFSAARFYSVTWLGERVTADLRSAVYARVLQQSPVFFETTQTGEVLSRLTTDTTLVQTVVGSSLSMGLRNLVMGLGAMGMLVWTNPRLMIPVLGVLCLVVLPGAWFGRRVRRLSRASQDRVADASALAAEVLNAMPVVQGFSAGPREASRFVASTESAFQTSVRRTTARSALVAFIISASSAALLWGLYQGTQSVLAGRMSAGHLGQTMVYVVILASAFAVLGEVYGDLQRAAGATERLMELLHAPIAIESPAQPKPSTREHASGTNPQPGMDAGTGAQVHFDQVTFAYPSRQDHPVLRHFNLHVNPGETVAIVGASGAGKSTLFQLLQRFYDITEGSVSLDGVDIRQQTLDDVRARMAVVPQDAVVFSTSALDNIRYGCPHATVAEVHAAAKLAFAHEFIMALPNGYDTFLGERGVRLSGGQRQRLCIARALLRQPGLLLLDEATSALDAESERLVQAALDAAMNSEHGRRTTLVIAHRLATVQRADRIVVLDEGHIIETGTHVELLQLGGSYARLAALQFGDDAVRALA